jgi:hypothetical protein
LKVIQAVPPIKDINQALTLGMDVAQVLKEARDCSVVAIDFLQQLDQELLEKARAILESRDPLERVREAISAEDQREAKQTPGAWHLILSKQEQGLMCCRGTRRYATSSIFTRKSLGMEHKTRGLLY